MGRGEVRFEAQDERRLRGLRRDDVDVVHLENPHPAIHEMLTRMAAKSRRVRGLFVVFEGVEGAGKSTQVGGLDTPGLDPIEQAVQTLTAQYGTLFVISAGNDGDDGSVNSASTADDALSVGAVSKTEELADFSSRGPRVGDYAIKPEITAPGVGIVAARSKDSQIGVPTGPDGKYMSLDGTSMAAPHVAGAAAILAQQHPEWTPAQLKATLMASAKPSPTIGVFGQGAGRVDIARAIRQSVTASPTSVSFGMQTWPHTDDKPMAKTVTYHNSGAAAVTLDLAFHTIGPDGKPTAAGLFTVSPSTVTVPAGGDAAVTVAADTRVGGDGYLGGQLTATAGDITVQTPVAVVKEVESYDLTMNVLDRAGNPTGEFNARIYGLDDLSSASLWDASGTVKLRLPKARFNITTTAYEWNGHSYDTYMMVLPVLNLDHSQTVTFDSRTAKPISVTVPDPDVSLLFGGVQFNQMSAVGPLSHALISPTFDGMFTAQVGPGGFELTSMVNGHWGRVQPNRSVLDSPKQYLLAWPVEGSFFIGLQRTVAQRDLATVRKKIAADVDGAQGITAAYPRVEGAVAAFWSVNFPYTLPGEHTEFYNTEKGIDWYSTLNQQLPGPPFPVVYSQHTGPYVTYQRGRAYQESWNRGVFGPAFPSPNQPRQWVTRTGDSLFVGVPVYGDGDGRGGLSVTDTASITVYKDGVKVAETPQAIGQFTVPAAAGEYRIVQAATRSAPFTLSTKVRTEWTVRSEHVDGTTPQALPLSAIGFLPKLDEHNAAPANVPFALPFQVQHQPDSAARPTRSVDVQVSYDDGRTWARQTVQRHGSTGVALLQHPAGSGFVSLKATATDTAGNTVEQTIIRAYRF